MEKPEISAKEERLITMQRKNPAELDQTAIQYASPTFAMRGMGTLIGAIITCGGTFILYWYLTAVLLIADWVMLVVYLMICFFGLLVICAYLTYIIRRSAWKSNPCFENSGTLLKECIR